MKLLVIGCGQCGGRIADEFRRLKEKARAQRGIEIITDCFAVNTDVADLSGLSFIRRDYQHRIVIGEQKTGGHGVGKINELGAEVAREDSDKVLEAIRKGEQLPDADAFLLAASAAGGTGSGAIPVLTQYLKERYPEKPVYDLIVLPFRHEELTEDRTIYNTATCLKSAYLMADAIFLVDNQRFVRKGLSLRNNIAKINAMVVEPFYNLLCAGEEKKAEYIGSRTLDAGDIIQTLAGWTAIGGGSVRMPLMKVSFAENRDFRKKTIEAGIEIQAMNRALDNLSLKCNLKDANRALYLLSAPSQTMNVELVKELGTALKAAAPDATIRSGDYPGRRRSLDVTIIVSELTSIQKVSDYFNKAILYLASRKKQKGKDFESQELETSFRDIPSLL